MRFTKKEGDVPFVSNLDKADNIAVFIKDESVEDESTKNESVIVMFRNYVDQSGYSLWFRQLAASQSWEFGLDPKFAIAEDQIMASARWFPKYLRLQSVKEPGKFKLILPVEHFSLDSASNKKGPEDPIGTNLMVTFDKVRALQQKTVLMLSIDSEGEIESSSRLENFLLGYNYLAGREYEKSRY